MSLSDFIAASSGASGAAFSTVVLYPIEVVKTNVNKGADHAGVKYKGLVDVITRVHAEHGLVGFYKGLSARTSHQTVQKFSFYYVYDFLRRVFRNLLKAEKLSFWPNLVVGYIAGVATVFVANPLEVVATRQQLSAKVAQGVEPPGLMAVFAKMISDEGIGVFYRGMVANLVLAINPAIENTIFDQIKTWFLSRIGAKALSVAQAFWLGAVAKIIATYITFPYIRAKVIMQGSKSKSGRSGAAVGETEAAKLNPPTTTIGVLGQIIEEEGFFAMWAGMAPQTVKAVLASAVLLAAKEKIEIAVRGTVLAVARRGK